MILGLTYIPNYIDESQEKELLSSINKFEWDHSLKRKTQHYGYKYDYTTRNIDSKKDNLGEYPEWLFNIHEIVKSTINKSSDQVIINHYEPGQGIAPHIDNTNLFDDTIVCLSLGSDIIMNFEKDSVIIPVLLEKRSLVIMRDDSRYLWTHSIKPVKNNIINGKRIPRSERISITFRNLKHI